MSRRKKIRECDAPYRSTDDEMVPESKRHLRFPGIQPGPARMVGVIQPLKADGVPNPSYKEAHGSHHLHLPGIRADKSGGRQPSYCNEYVSWEVERQAKMDFVAKRMTQKNAERSSHQLEATFATTVGHDDSGSYYPKGNSQVDSFEDYGCFYEREAVVSSAERERELDRKRQAMLELRDREINFFRKCNGENIGNQHLEEKPELASGQHQQPTPTRNKDTEKQKKHKAKTSKQWKIHKELIEKSQNGDFLSWGCKESMLPLQTYDAGPKQSSPNHFQTNTLKMQMPLQSFNMAHSQPLVPQPLPPICRPSQTLPAIEEKQPKAHSPSPSIQRSGKYRREPMPPSTMIHTAHVPMMPLIQRETPLLDVISSPLNGENLSIVYTLGSDSSFEFDHDNTPGSPTHVVRDEEWKKELRLDLSFARTPVPKQQTKISAKQSGKNVNTAKIRNKSVGRS